MSTNFKVALHSGNPHQVDYTPGSAVTGGDVIIINGVAYFAPRDIASGDLGALSVAGGVWKGNKAAGAWVNGDAIYWNPTGNPNVGTAGTGAFENTSGTSKTFAGYAVGAALTGDQFGYFVKAMGATSQLRAVSGQLTTVTASDTVVTGLAKVVAVVASLDSDPIDNPEWVSASIGDQAGTPASGSILIKTWQNTGGTDPTPTAASTFSKKVNWVAYGY